MMSEEQESRARKIEDVLTRKVHVIAVAMVPTVSWVATYWIDEFPGQILVGIWCAITWEVFIHLRDVDRLRIELKTLHDELAIATPFFRSLHRIPQVDRYTELLEKHAALQHLSPTLGLALKFMLKAFDQQGIAIVSATNGQYLEVLEECLHSAEEAFEAIITPTYPPWWFFENQGEPPQRERTLYLQKVRTATGIERKLRLMIFDWDAKREDVKREGVAFRQEFVNKLEVVRQFLEEGGAFESDPSRGSVKHYLFDWDGYRRYDETRGFADPFEKLCTAIENIRRKGQDFAVMDGRVVVMKSAQSCLQVVPLPRTDEHYTAIFHEFRDPTRSGERFWISLDDAYLNACSCVGELLSKTAYEEHPQNCASCGSGAGSTEGGRA